MGLKAKYYENKVMFVDKCVKFGKKKKKHVTRMHLYVANIKCINVNH